MKFLVANDGSKAARDALRYAIRLAPQLTSPSCSLTLINVHDDAGLRCAKTCVGSEAVSSYLRDVGNEELAQAKLLLADFAKQGGFDLIVPGARGAAPSPIC